jgi:hypothetical protein
MAEIMPYQIGTWQEIFTVSLFWANLNRDSPSFIRARLLSKHYFISKMHRGINFHVFQIQ